jgi:hypothetical protein
VCVCVCVCVCSCVCVQSAALADTHVETRGKVVVAHVFSKIGGCRSGLKGVVNVDHGLR